MTFLLKRILQNLVAQKGLCNGNNKVFLYLKNNTYRVELALKMVCRVHFIKFY